MQRAYWAMSTISAQTGFTPSDKFLELAASFLKGYVQLVADKKKFARPRLLEIKPTNVAFVMQCSLGSRKHLHLMKSF